MANGRLSHRSNVTESQSIRSKILALLRSFRTRGAGRDYGIYLLQPYVANQLTTSSGPRNAALLRTYGSEGLRLFNPHLCPPELWGRLAFLRVFLRAAAAGQWGAGREQVQIRSGVSRVSVRLLRTSHNLVVNCKVASLVRVASITSPS
jgi:hypothetical protein